MKKVHLSDVPIEHRKSPKGRFELQRRHLSLELGGVKNTGPWGGGHPFDIEWTSLPPGKANYPIHSHAAQTEFYIFLSGSGIVRNDQEHELEIREGDHLICNPGDAHQIENTGTTPLVYYVIADHHPADVGTYSLTGKRWLGPEQRVVTVENADYYAGEE